MYSACYAHNVVGQVRLLGAQHEICEILNMSYNRNMEKHRAHDIVHTFHGGMASNCPFCQGTMDEKEMKNYAEEIAQDHFKPSVNPNLPYDQRMAMQMAEIKSRASMPDSDFAYVDSKGGKHLPINDANHVRAALSRFNQTHFDSEAEKKAAWTKIDKKADEGYQA